MEPRRSWRAPSGQGVTFVELFFDLVFVFAVTGVARFALHDPTLLGGARALLVFWMVWWAWTQLTWALNGADTTITPVRAGALAATAIALVMAVSVENAFEAGGGLWFIVPYVAVRVLGLALYLRVAAVDRAWVSVVRTFAGFSLLGLAAAIAGGIAQPSHRTWWWTATILLDLAAAMIGGRRQDWNLYAPHFAERHGLFVIIALGESLLAVGVPATGSRPTLTTLIVLIAAAALVCLLWWTYFGWFKDALERTLHARIQARDPQFARDAYSLLHFPLVAGIVGVAVGLEPMIARPEDAVQGPALAAFAVGLMLFVSSCIPIAFRARWRLLPWRIAFSLVIPPILWIVRNETPAIVILAAAATLVALVVAESVRPAAPPSQPSEVE